MRGCTGELKQRIQNGDFLVFGCVMDSRSGSVIEMYEHMEYDAVLIDREHTALNDETILEHIRLARALGLPCMVRVADTSYHELNCTLDQAPDGIFVPRIRTREEVEYVVKTVKYPPEGVRGLASGICPVAKYTSGVMADQVAFANNDVVIGIQIETAEALTNLDEILSVSGIDVALVGNDDLSLGMGILGQVDNPEYLDAVMSVIDACHRHNVMPGIAAFDAARVKFWADRGMRLFWYSADICLIWNAASDAMAALREQLGDTS